MSELEAGPALDARVAEALGLPGGLPYSTDIAAAWQVIVSLRAREWHYLLEEGFDGQHVAVFMGGRHWWQDPDESCKARAATPMLAICRAALATVASEAAP